MREIDNNLNNIKFRGVQKPEEKIQEETSVPTTAPVSEFKEITDLKNMPSAELGKSQVASADTTENDIKFLTKHPEVVANLNKIIDNYASSHTEEETLKFIDTTLQEFAKK